MSVLESVRECGDFLVDVGVNYLIGLVIVITGYLFFVYKLVIRDLRQEKVNLLTWFMVSLLALLSFFFGSLFRNMLKESSSFPCPEVTGAILESIFKFVDVFNVGVVLALVSAMVSYHTFGAPQSPVINEKSKVTKNFVIQVSVGVGTVVIFVNAILLFLFM